MKVSIIGSGDVGSQAAIEIAGRQIADEVVLLDIIDGLPQGRALDIQQYCPTIDSETRIIGTNSYSDIRKSDVVVITSGVARKPGVASRDDLLETNKKIIASVSKSVANYSPDAVIIVVTNPVDIMSYIALKASGFEKNKVIGISGVLDSSRLVTMIAEKAGCRFADIDAMVIGMHGNYMVPLLSRAKIKGRSVTEFITGADCDEIKEKLKNASKEIITRTNRSTFSAPGGSIAKMVETVLNDSREILPCSSYLEGEYSLSDVYIGVPVVLGRNGVENIIEFDLKDDEKEMFLKGAEKIKETTEKINGEGKSDSNSVAIAHPAMADKKEEEGISQNFSKDKSDESGNKSNEENKNQNTDEQGEDAIAKIEEDLSKLEDEINSDKKSPDTAEKKDTREDKGKTD